MSNISYTTNRFKLHFRFVLMLAAITVWGLSACATSPRSFSLQGGTPQAEALFKSLADEAQTRGQYDDLFQAGWAAWLLHNNGAASRSFFEKAISANPSNPEASMALGLVCYLEGRLTCSQSAFIQTLTTSPTSPYASLAAGFLAEFYQHTPDFPQKVTPTFEKLIDHPNLSRRTRRHITHTLARLYRENGKREQSLAMQDRLGSLQQYALIGPFGEFGLLDIDQSFEPETATPLSCEYATTTESLEAYPVDERLFRTKIRDISDRGGVFYAVSYFKLENSYNVLLQLQTRHPSILFIDNVEVARHDTRQAYLPPLTETVVGLAAGWHKLVLKIGSHQPNIGFDLGLTGVKGEPIALTWSADCENPPTLATDSSPKKADLPEAEERFWSKRADANPDIYTLLFSLLANMEILDIERVKQDVERALAINPHFAPLYTLRALNASSDPALPQRFAQDIARRDLKKALELDPAQAMAAHQLVEDDVAQDRIEKAIERLHTLIKQEPSYYFWYKSLFQIYNHNQWHEEAEKAAKQTLARNNRDLDFLQDLYLYYRSRSDFASAAKLVERIAQLDGPGLTYSRWLEEGGKYDEAEQQIRRSLEWIPYDRTLRRALAKLSTKRGNFKQAIEIYSALRKHPGTESQYSRELARVLVLNDRKAEAKNILEKHLKQKPGAFNVRRDIAFLSGTEILGDSVTSAETVIADFLKDNFKPEAGAVVVLDEYITRIFEDGSAIGRTHIVTRVQTKEAQTRYGEIYLPRGAEIYQLRVIKPDGRILVPDNVAGLRSITMPNLEVGDFIEMDYAEGTSKNNSLSNGRLFTARFMFRMLDTPVFRSHFRVQHPSDLPVNRFAMNYEGSEPVRHEENGWISWDYLNSKLDAIFSEPFMPVKEEVLPIVHLSLPVDWRELRDYFRQKRVLLDRPTTELRKFLNENQVNGESEFETVRRLFYAIANTVEGEDNDHRFGSTATQILLNKNGNRLLLLAALLDMIDIENEFILARPITVQPIGYPNAYPSAYSSPMLRVRLQDGQTLYLESRFKESVFNRPSPLLSGTRALVLTEEADVFTRLPVWTTQGEAKEVSLFIKLKGDGSAQAEAIERIGGYYSAGLRRKLKQIPTDRRKPFFEMVLSRNFPGAQIESVDIANLADPDLPIELHYTFTIGRMARVSRDTLRIEGGFFPLELLQSYIRLPSRNYPMLINGINSGVNTTVLQLPPGTTLASLPEPKNVSESFGRYSLNVETKGQTVTFTRDFAIPIQRVELSDYMNFYRFCAEIDRSEREGIVVRLLTEASAPSN